MVETTEEFSPQVKAYLLRWRCAASAIAFSCTIAVQFSAQLQVLKNLSTEEIPLLKGLIIGLAYFSEIVVLILFAAVQKKTSKKRMFICLSLLCLLATFRMIVESSDLTIWFVLLCCVCGATEADLLSDYITTMHLCKFHRKRMYPLTPCVGFALVASGMITNWLRAQVDGMQIVICCPVVFSACATGIFLKFSGQTSLPEIKDELPAYVPLKQRTMNERVELGMLFLSAAVNGAVLTFLPFRIGGDAFDCFYLALIVLLGIIPLRFGEKRMMRLLLTGTLLAAFFGIPLLWGPLRLILMCGLCAGETIVLHYAEEMILPRKKPGQAAVALIGVKAAMMFGIVMTGVSLSVRV